MIKTLPSNAGGVGSIPGLGAKIPHASRPKKTQNIKQKHYCNKFNEEFINVHIKKNLKKKKIEKGCAYFLPLHFIGRSQEIIFQIGKEINNYISMLY